MRPGSSEGLLLCVLPHPPPPVLTLPGGGAGGGGYQAILGIGHSRQRWADRVWAEFQPQRSTAA